MNLGNLRRRVKAKFPDGWEFLKTIDGFLRYNVPIIQPQLFTDLEKLSATAMAHEMTCEEGKKSKVLIFGVRQDRLHVSWEFVIAQALKIRGHIVDYIGCDGSIQRCCNEGWYPKLKRHQCKRCFWFSKKVYEKGRLGVSWLGDYAGPQWTTEASEIVDNLDFSSYRELDYKGLPVGELVRPSVSHFCRVEDIELFGASDSRTREIYRDFLVGAVIMINVCESIIAHHSPDVILMVNGLFMSERMMFEIARKKGIRTVVMESGLQPDTLVLLHDHYIDYRKLDGWEQLKKITLTGEQEDSLDRYMLDRERGAGQTLTYWNDRLDDKRVIFENFQLNKFRKIALLFPNVTWDSALYGLDIMFKTLHEWIGKTISYFENHPELCLIIRCHPADVTWQGAMRDSVFRWLKTIYREKLPDNVKVIPPDSPVSSYTLMDIADIGLVFSSTTGLEMALEGKPVVVVGKVHYWNRGFTIDPETENDYYKTLDRILFSTSEDGKYRINVELARRYAYFVFFEGSMRLKYVNSNNYRTVPKLTFSSYEDLLPGKDLVLDKICDGIIEGKPFVY